MPKRPLQDSGVRTVLCDEGCGCHVSSRRAFVTVIDGAAHRFCCAGCADSYQKNLGTETGKILREHVGPGLRAADIGCGSGFYTALLAERVGPKGRVYAVDTDPANVHRTEEYLARRGLQKRVTVAVAAGDHLALLPDGALDFLFSNNVLCCTKNRAGVRREIVRALRSGGTAYVRVSDASPQGVRALSEGEWDRWIAPFHRLGGGNEAGSRWALLLKPPPNGRAGEAHSALPIYGSASAPVPPSSVRPARWLRSQHQSRAPLIKPARRGPASAL